MSIARKFSDGSVAITGLTDYTDPSAPAAVTSVDSITGRLYDGDRRTRVTVDLDDAGGLQLRVESAVGFEIGDAVEIRLDDAVTLHTSTVTNVTSTAESVTLTDAIPAGRVAKRGAWLQKPIGASFPIETVYGTPLPDRYEWGYIGFYADDLDLFDVENVRAEADIVVTGGARLFKALTMPVFVEG